MVAYTMSRKALHATCLHTGPISARSIPDMVLVLLAFPYAKCFNIGTWRGASIVDTIFALLTSLHAASASDGASLHVLTMRLTV